MAELLAEVCFASALALAAGVAETQSLSKNNAMERDLQGREHFLVANWKRVYYKLFKLSSRAEAERRSPRQNELSE